MESNTSSVAECTGVLNEDDADTNDGDLNKNVVKLKPANDRKIEIIWQNAIPMVYAHLGAIYGLYI